MDTLDTVLQKATREHWALGHFNISNLEMLKAIAEAVRHQGSYALIGLSEGERAHVGLSQAVALIRAYQSEGRALFLNADHSKSVETAIAAADAGFDSIHIDASEHPYEQNIEMTKAVVDHAKKRSADVSVEGELGFVPGQSRRSGEEISVNETMYTHPDRVAEFVEKTGVDRLAVFVGNIHGINKNEPKLDVLRIAAIRKNVPDRVSLVLHAGSGIPDEDIRAAVDAGIANIHISTELRLAFTHALKQTFQSDPENTTPYKYMKPSMDAVQSVVEKKIIVFGAARRYT